MSWEKLPSFLPLLNIFPIFDKKKLIEVPVLCFITYSKLKMKKYIFLAVIFEVIEATQVPKVANGSKIGNLGEKKLKLLFSHYLS